MRYRALGPEPNADDSSRLVAGCSFKLQASSFKADFDVVQLLFTARDSAVRKQTL